MASQEARTSYATSPLLERGSRCGQSGRELGTLGIPTVSILAIKASHVVAGYSKRFDKLPVTADSACNAVRHPIKLL